VRVDSLSAVLGGSVGKAAVEFGKVWTRLALKVSNCEYRFRNVMLLL
jgi:hypothetical protein